MSSKQLLLDQDYELLSATLDGELSDAEQKALQERLKADTLLENELESLRRTSDLIRQLPDMPLPRDFVLTQQMLDEQKTRRPLRLAIINTHYLSWVASIVLMFIGVYFLASEMTLAAPGAIPPAEFMMADEAMEASDGAVAAGLSLPQAREKSQTTADSESAADMRSDTITSDRAKTASRGRQSAVQPPEETVPVSATGIAFLLGGAILFVISILRNRASA